MRNNFYLAASVFTFLVCIGIASSQSSAAYAEGVTPTPSATKDSGTGVIRQITGTIVGIKRLSQRVMLLTLDNGVIVQINPASDVGPTESIALNFTKITITYTNQSGDGHTLIARTVKIDPSTTPSRTPTGIPTGCVDKINCFGTTNAQAQR